MLDRKGFTLMEIIVVLIIMGIVVAFGSLNYTKPIQQARAQNAVNNLLAIYSAQQNYYNNNGYYCFSSSPSPYNSCANLAGINSSLSLNIQDDGSYTYACDTQYGTVPNCYATYSAYSTRPITIWMSTAIQYPLSQNKNPYSGDCPGTKCPF